MEILSFQNRNLVVADEWMSRTLLLSARAAQCQAVVLIIGESGTGKELIARYVHEKSPRSKGPFVSVNCAAIPEGLLEAEFFGHERGAFTGAIAQRIGRFEQANAGTLLLDEIGEMPVALQAKLLRVLQEGEIDRLGGKDAVVVNCRVIATTNKDPLALVREGKFRADLYYRLNVIRIECMPLRGRAVAIQRLAHHFLSRFAMNQGNPRLGLTAAAERRLVQHGWPGNIRELQNVMERAALFSEGVIDVSDLETLLDSSAPYELGSVGTIEALEQSSITRALSVTGGNRTEAAKQLGITTRTLRNKLKRYREATG